MEKLGTTNKLAGYGYVFDRYVKRGAFLSHFPRLFSWLTRKLGQLFKETLFVAMQTKAASQHRGPATTYKIIVSNSVHVGLFQRSTYIVFCITSGL